MRITLCGLGHSRTRRLPKQESGDGCVGLSAFIVKLVIPSCLVRKKMRLHPTHNNEEVKQEVLLKNKSKPLTLEECILASPDRNVCNSRVYPTFEKNNQGLFKKVGESLPTDKVLTVEVDEGDRVMKDTSARSSLIVSKSTKRVSFRMPEVADIFIMDSSAEYSAM